jgi:hypothetical protein
MNMEMLTKAKAELDRKIEEARLLEGTQLMRTILRGLEFYQFTLDDLTQFAASEKQVRREEKTGPVGAIGRDVELGAIAMQMLNSENGDEAATLAPLEEGLAMADDREDEHRVGSAAASMTAEMSSRRTNRSSPHRCPPLQLRGLLSSKAGRRR